jgi:hypothetical protein
MIDRSQFLEELRNNPALLHRIAVITAGEVSASAPIEKQMIQAETIFNRAMARGITLEQATRQVGQGNPDGKQGGYYPASTFAQGEQSLARNGGEARFRELVLKPVIGGSDVGTEKLGFAPTGNASGNFAASRAAGGVYAKSKWYGDPAKGGEMYVEEKTGMDRPERIAAMRKGGPQPNVQLASADGGPVATSSLPDVNYATPRRTPQEQFAYNELQKYYGGKYQPPGVVDTVNAEGQPLRDQVPLPPTRPAGAPPRPAEPGAPAAAPPASPAAKPSTGDLLAGTVATPNASAPGSAWEPTNAEQEFITAGATTPPTPDGRPAPPAPAAPAAPQTTTTISASAAKPAPPAGTLGAQIIKAMGPRGQDRSSYIDPNTGHEILNPPARSGEESMGITRDLGPPRSPPAQPRSSAAPSNNPRASGPPAPAAQAQAPPESWPKGPTVNLDRYNPAGFLPDQSWGGSSDPAAPKTGFYYVPPGVPPPNDRPSPPAWPTGQVASAGRYNPAEITLADRLRPLNQVPIASSSLPPPAPKPPGFDTTSFDKTPMPQSPAIDMGPRLAEGPTPLAALKPPQADFLSSVFGNLSRTPDRPLSSPLATADRSLSPFEPGARNAAFPLAPESARMLAGPPGASGLDLPKSLERPSASSSFGGSTAPISFGPSRTVDQQLMGLSPFAPLPQPPRPEPPPQQAPQIAQQQQITQMMQPEQSPVTNTANLSPFEQWPPPWWNTGGGDWGGGGGGFGGGFDFGAFA